MSPDLIGPRLPRPRWRTESRGRQGSRRSRRPAAQRRTATRSGFLASRGMRASAGEESRARRCATTRTLTPHATSGRAGEPKIQRRHRRPRRHDRDAPARSIRPPPSAGLQETRAMSATALPALIAEPPTLAAWNTSRARRPGRAPSSQTRRTRTPPQRLRRPPLSLRAEGCGGLLRARPGIAIGPRLARLAHRR